MKPTTACMVCGRPGAGTRCPRHEREHQQRRGSSGYKRQRTNQQILENAMYMCAKCGKRGEIVDHIRPLWAGGSDEPRNKQVLCDHHHREKTSAEARMRNGRRRGQ
jgi:5-methylcytosine-specific restriction endonuclease McrA